MNPATGIAPADVSSNGHKKGAKITHEDIAVSDLMRIEDTQRPLQAGWVRKLYRNMDLDALGTFTVSRRDDGRLILLDGGHRQAALFEHDMGDWSVRCEVYHGLDLPTEAGLFRRLNSRRSVSALEDFLKGVVEGDGECVVINRTCKRVGLKVARQVGPGNIVCVSALRRVYAGRGSKVHPEELKRTLELVTGAWGHTPEAVEGQIVAGVGEFVKRYHADVDYDDLRKKLAKYQGGPSRLLGNGRNLKEITNRPIWKCIAEIVLNTYNKQRRTNVLPPL